MDVERLALQAKDGDREALAALWVEVKQFACSLARARYGRLAQMNGGADEEDLDQMAALGVLLAVSTYDPGGGCSFASWMAYYVRHCCRKGLGLAGRQRVEHYYKTSIDKPLPDAEDCTLADTIPDETALDPCAAAELDGLRHDVLAAVARLPQPERGIITRCDLGGEQQCKVAQALGVPGYVLAHTRTRGLKRLQMHLRGYAPNYSRHKGVAAFKTTWSSVVEDEVIRADQYERSM